MALVLKDRVKESTTTSGTGSITLAGTSSGYQSFSVIGDGNTTYYAIALQGGDEWEVGIGTYTASGTTLSRDTVLESSNSGSLVDFSAGTKDVFVTYPAEKSVSIGSNVSNLTNDSGYLTAATCKTTNGLFEMANTISSNYSITSGNNAISGGPITISSGVSVTVPSGSVWTVV